MGRPRQFANATERKRAHRRKQRAQEEAYAQLVLLQEAAAQEHVVVLCGRMLQMQQHATAEQLQLQAEAKERDMLDALWVLQTLIYSHRPECEPKSPVRK